MNCVTTLEIVRDYFTFRLNEAKNLAEHKSDYFASVDLECLTPRDKIFATLRQLTYSAELKNRECFDRYINFTFNQIDDLKKLCELERKLQQVAESFFNDHEISWSRIIVILSFVAYMSYKYAWMQRDLTLATACACCLVQWLTTYLACKFGMWIECQGGWVWQQKINYFIIMKVLKLYLFS